MAKLEDIQGLKIRVQQIPVFIDTFSALGANAVPMPFPELYTALETKTVDGQENPFVSVEVTKFYEVQKYASNTRHAYSPLLVLASKKFWDQLSDDERKILLEAASEAKPYQRQTSRAMDAKAVDTLKSQGNDRHRDLRTGTGADARKAEAGHRKAQQDDQRIPDQGRKRRNREGARIKVTNAVARIFGCRALRISGFDTRTHHRRRTHERITRSNLDSCSRHQ